MTDDTRITYKNDGTPRFVTIDGVEYDPADLRLRLQCTADLRYFVALALLFGMVIGAALVLAFVH